MKIIILDFSSSKVDIKDLPPEIGIENDSVEEWLQHDYNLDEIQFMYGEGIDINIINE